MSLSNVLCEHDIMRRFRDVLYHFTDGATYILRRNMSPLKMRRVCQILKDAWFFFHFVVDITRRAMFIETPIIDLLLHCAFFQR